MKRLFPILLLITVTLATYSLTAGLAENVNEPELLGTWQFVGGGEVMGDGFRLNAEGTGRCLEAEYTEGYPKHLQATGATFRWEYADGIFTVSFGRNASYDYPITRHDHRIHFAEGEGGGFYQKYDEDAIRAEIEARIQTGTATEFDALVLDYITDDLESALAENLHLRSVVTTVDWYSEEKSVTISAWQLDLDHDLTIRFTESDTTVSIGTAESTWFTNSGIRVNPTANRYYQAARAAMDQAMECYKE